jgi:hypothetical protein
MSGKDHAESLVDEGHRGAHNTGAVKSGLAEFERELIRARTGEGRSRAKARGVRFGRPPKLTAHQRQGSLPAACQWRDAIGISHVPMLSIQRPSGACWGPLVALSAA